MVWFLPVVSDDPSVDCGSRGEGAGAGGREDRMSAGDVPPGRELVPFGLLWRRRDPVGSAQIRPGAGRGGPGLGALGFTLDSG